jgi:hypothetical protein
MGPELNALDRVEVLLKLLATAEDEARRLRAEIATELAKRRGEPADVPPEEQPPQT